MEIISISEMIVKTKMEHILGIKSEKIKKGPKWECDENIICDTLQ